VPPSELADTVRARLTVLYPTAADPGRAASAAAYMKDVASFLGIPTPQRRALSRTVLDGTGRPDEVDCAAVALRCWKLPEREYQYFAADYLRRHVPAARPGSCPSYGTPSPPSPGGTPSMCSPPMLQDRSSPPTRS
jgi:hypothetical protein